MRDLTSVWKFSTRNFTVELCIEPCHVDPADCFDDAETIEEIRSGRYAWFDATVFVALKGAGKVGSDSLSACVYRDVEEFITGHRDPDPLNRNCTIMRAARGQNVIICHYFPDMVRMAIADARRELAARMDTGVAIRKVLQHAAKVKALNLREHA